MIKGNILLVDDDLDDQLIFKDALKRNRFCLSMCVGQQRAGRFKET